MRLKDIFKNNELWIARKLERDADYFQKLSEGQQPKILYIGCSDSRVSAEEMMGAEPGEIFVHRNIANMVVNTDLNVKSVLQYGVTQLKVEHIVVCGHYGCGGVHAAMQQEDLGILNPWLRNIRDVYRLHKDELNTITDTEKRYKRFVEINVVEQCINILKTADVQRKIRDRSLMVHGWVFDIATGKLIDLEIDVDYLLSEIMEMYRLD